MVYLTMDRSLSLNAILEQVSDQILADFVDIVQDEKDEKEMMKMMDRIEKGGKTFQCPCCFSKFKKSDDLQRHKNNNCDLHQYGGGDDDDEPGPSTKGTAYSLRLRGERVFMKNKARERTFEITFNREWQGRKLTDLHHELRDMLRDAIERASQDHNSSTDLVRIVLHHREIEPIVVTLRPIKDMTAEAVLETVSSVLNSHQHLSLDSSVTLDVGVIALPKGGSKVRMNRIKGDGNCIHRKHSIVQIVNEDQMCMARALAVAWGRSIQCTKEEWMAVTMNRDQKTNLELIMETCKMPKTHYKNLIRKNSNEQTKLAKELLNRAGLPCDRKLSINDLHALEQLLDCRIVVLSASLGNRICYKGQGTCPPKIYLYLVDDDHFHAITSITGFFSTSYFCTHCLKPYNDRNRHLCGGRCLVCKRQDECEMTDEPYPCTDCNMTCRSAACYEAHKDTNEGKKLSECQR